VSNWPFGDLIPNHYGLVLVDDPWRFKTFNSDVSAKSAAGHYQVMDKDALRALPVADLAAKDCALVMWATQAQMPEAIDLMKARGFTYKTMGAWAKQSKTGKKWAFGTGYVLRSAAEFYIIGTRGKPKAQVRNVRNLIVAPAREHSRKPDQMHADLERLFPGPRCELFARETRPGWAAWGNETSRFNQMQAESLS
jgi:N6-adenosine-specific RNA methylase IME4